MQPIKAKPDDGMCYRCHGIGIEPYPHLFEETNNKTTMKEEDDTMTTTTMNATVNYKEMKWNDLVAYAKSLGINTGHKKRIDIELELDNLKDSVSTGDMTYDKYYPELQEETIEDKIKKAINKAKFDATYNGKPVNYIMVKSLKTIIKYNLEEKHRTHPSVDSIVERVIQKMINKGILYRCTNRFYGVR